MIEAMLVDHVNREDVAQWCNGRIYRDGKPGLIVETLYGLIRANVGDVVIRTPWGFDVFTKKTSDINTDARRNYPIDN